MTTALAHSEDEYNSRMIKIMDDAAVDFDELMCSALPYLFSGMRAAQVADSLTALTGRPISSETIWDWMGREPYARYVSQGRSLMRQWNLTQLQQLAVIGYDLIRRELNNAALNGDEERRQIDTAKFVIRELGKTRPREVRHQIDDPALHVAAESAVFITERIARLIESGGTKKEREVVIGEYTTVERDDMESISIHDGVIPAYGLVHVDWEEGRMQCHACGKWVTDVAAHSSGTHKITISDYKDAYGIASDIPLSFAGMNESFSWRGTALTSIGEERGLVPYEMTFEEMVDGRQDKEADSTGG